MWFFRSPEIVFGEGALDHLANLEGSRALIVTDANIERLGLVDLVRSRLADAGIAVALFAEVEPNPSLQTTERGAQVALQFQPDWIIGVGGGSCLDAAKSVWIQYERPDLTPDDVAPVGKLGLRQKARLVAVPTTSGTGAEVTWPIILTDTAEHRKITVGHPENIPDLAIVDPCFVRLLPAQITGDTGMDALTHAIEGYSSTWHNDFADGLCLKAIQLVFDNLECSCLGHSDEARERMHNAATIAGLGFGNSIAALAHGLGHSMGALLPVPHGRAVGLCLPYTIEYSVQGDMPTRYADIARFLGLPHADEAQSAASLAAAIRALAQSIGQPTSLRGDNISPELFAARLEQLVENTVADGATAMGTRIPDEEEVDRLLRYIYEGQPIDF